MTPEEDNLKIFTDPELKAALMRAFPVVRAPESLQARVRNLIDDEMGADQSLKLTLETGRSGWRQWLTSGRQLAAAACIAGLALGIALFSLTQGSNTTRPQLASNGGEPTLVQTAVDRHDALGESVNSGGLQFQQMLRTAPQMRDELKMQKSISLPLVDLSQQGWQFVGAKPGRDDGPCLGQLFFKRGKQSLSVIVFSDDRTPANCVITRGHIVALRKIPNGVVCVVGYCPTGELAQNEVEQIASEFAQ